MDRHAVVSRHNVIRTAGNPDSPLQVGNGEFAFGADITGLQTFVPFNTMSNWGWHECPLPPGQTPSDYQGKVVDTHGRQIRYPVPDDEHKAISDWLYMNPRRLNLGRIGMRLTTADGRDHMLGDLSGCRQELDLWSGTLDSRFEVGGEPVHVRTGCHPTMDLVAVRVESPLIGAGRLSFFVDFPYDGTDKFETYVGDWNHPDAHQTTVRASRHRADFVRRLDAQTYHVALAWPGRATFGQESTHRYTLGDAAEFVVAFSPDPLPDRLPTAGRAFAAAATYWRGFWTTGGAIDLSASTDPRAMELERRIVQSQYLMAVNASGSLPPQESGLVNNGWHGKFHLEMYWWHAAHWALWDRWPLLDRGLGAYHRFLAGARERARWMGLDGARWPKMTGPDGRDSPGLINGLLAWQQPHPLFFAELDYRAHPTRATLDRWRDVVFGTADLLASYASWEPETRRYVLGPPIYLMPENTEPETTENPAFELAYWRFGLRIAQTWRRRLGLAPHPEWAEVAADLAPLPVQDGTYVLYEGVEDMWTKWTFEHPSLAGVYGFLPGDGVDPETMRRTADRVFGEWQFDTGWGWDFPMLAMCAARLGRPSDAVDFLLHSSAKFQFDDYCLSSGGPFPYFPSNGGLLYAVAMMAAGWDGAPATDAPGFPGDGTWTVRHEGLRPAL